MKLLKQDSYIDTLKNNKELIEQECNGCGPSGWLSIFIPNYFYGLDISEACQIHDWDYYEGTDWTDKLEADTRFLYNLMVIINRNDIHTDTLTTQKRLDRAILYYKFVSKYGESAFIADRKGVHTKKTVESLINKDKEDIDNNINIGHDDGEYL